jgi:deoxycytidine triphosphate deaminase
LAVDAQAYSESLGDIRIHYAGFAHPHFGHERPKGTPLIFEVRGHNMDTILRDGDALAKVYFRRMSKNAKRGKKDQYDAQELKLSGCFKDWQP